MINGKVLASRTEENTSILTIQTERIPERIKEVALILDDKEHITETQRGMIFGLCRDIAKQADGTDMTYDQHRKYLLKCFEEANEMNNLSMRKSSMSKFIARAFINYILAYMIFHDIELSEQNHKQFTQHEGYVYQLIMKRKCVCCGKHGAHIHHVGGYEDEFDEYHSSSRIGLGNDRSSISHVGRKVLPLCVEHHNQAHTKGDTYVINTYCLAVVEVDKALNKKIKGK